VRSPAGTHGLQLALLAVAMAGAGYTRTAISPLQEAMRIALAMTDNQMAVLQGPVVGVPVALASIPLGLLIDRWSRVRLLNSLLLLSLIGSVCTATASNFSVLLLARGLAGLTGLAVIPVVFSVLADLYPPEQRGRVITVALIGQVAGNSAAFALGGALLSASGAQADGWRWSMFWLTTPIVPIVLSSFLLREPVRTGLIIERPTARELWRELRQYRAVISVVASAVILVEMAIGAMLIWGAPMLSRIYGVPPDRVGAIMGAGMLISGVLGPILGGLLADLCQRNGGPPRTASLLGAMALLAAPAGLFAFLPNITIASALLIAAMTLMLVVAVMGIALFSVVLPSELRGLCMSVLVAACIMSGLAVAPPVVSILSGAIGGLAMIGKALSLVCVASSLFAALVLVVGRKYLPSAAV
jgi:predicted MFS family arabinose efflux permease